MKRAAVAVLLLLACRSEPLPIYPAGTAFQTRDLVVAGTRLRLIDTGQGPAVVFLHGIAASLYTWRHQLEPVLHAGYRVVAYDNRGFGFSDRPDSGYDNAAYAALLVALLDSLDIPDAVLVGHSMGGAVAAELALLAPARVRGLVLIGPAGFGPRGARLGSLPGLRDVATVFVSRGNVAATLRLCFADPDRVTANDVNQYYAPFTVRGARFAFRQVLREFEFEALRGRADSIGVPTLILWGPADRFIPFQAIAGLAEALPRAAVTLIRDAGHNPHEEQPEEVNRLITAYLQYGLPATPPDLAAGHSNATGRSTPSRSRGGSGSGATD